MNGFISTFWPINKLAATFTPICAASLPWRPVQGKSAENATASMITVKNCPIGSVLKNVRRWLSSESVWEFGKWTHWLVKDSVVLW
ncbi:MAG: hypothetical protein IMZ53_06530 [Thermoplasmata archaeon]|nr:hypothetical protein [Thermoplasmata archaeon]